MSKIQVLPPEEARKIAAGEVIDRPSALLREFMDNALDASASMVEVSIEGGGIIRCEVSDDGEGMSREDLELCCLTHATSKIRSLSDLEKAETLGFRGEALAAVAAVSRLEILSSRDGREAWKLEAGPGVNPHLEPGRRNRGSSVRSLGLFDSIPARKRFLKREGSEAASCRNIFNDKALAFPDRSFRFFQDGKLKIFLPPDPSFKDRFSRTLLGEREGKFLNEITAQGMGFQAQIVFGGPELWRRDRRQQFIFANNRRIQDYALLQALEYGLRGLFPNGTHPVGAVFVNIDPSLADFNIHPAKREVRFADPASIHHAITSTLENFQRRAFPSFAESKDSGENYLAFEKNRDDSWSAQKLASQALAQDETPEALFSGENPPAYASGNDISAAIQPPDSGRCKGNGHRLGNVRCLGRLFELFILIEYMDKLYIIDQHAAHERILYNRFIRGNIAQQELLVAIPFTTKSAEDDAFLRNERKRLADLGVSIEDEGDQWRIEALPAGWKLSDGETVREILNLKYAGKNMAEQWAIRLSCIRAVKDKDYLDEDASLALAKEAMSLPDPHCPHGRPIWHEVRRDEILQAVRRT